MRIKIISVGKLKEDFWRIGENYYKEKLRKICNLEIIEVADEKIPNNNRATEYRLVKEKEGEKILRTLSPCRNNRYVEKIYALVIEGKKLSEDLFSKILFQNETDIVSTFIIGGSLGLDSSVLQKANLSISFSALTFPHQLMRIILLESIWYAFNKKL